MSTDSDDSDGSLQIQQDVRGDRNQAIGQVLGGIVINQLTIQERVPAAVVPPIVAAAPPLTQQEYRQRQVLLSKVKDYWIKGVLKTSLHARAMIELGLHARPDLVQHPFQDVAEFPNIAAQALPEGTSATTTFDQMGQGRTLLILGEPGSGKTVTLLKLAEDLIARTEQALSQPIPVVINLSSWGRKPQPIEKWLIQELKEKYKVSKSLGKTWVKTESLILLLDGLDEVKSEQRNACIQALNRFMASQNTTELVVCCRIQDYQNLDEQLALRSAISIQPLTLEQIQHYVEQDSDSLQTLKILLQQDQNLQALARSPLMLSVMSLAYQGCALKDIVIGGTKEDYRDRLLNAYVERMFERRRNTSEYDRNQVKTGLVWLAQRMTAASQSMFLIERLQPSWFHTSSQQRLYSAALGLTGAVLGAIIYGATGIAFFELTRGLQLGLVGGIIFGLVYGIGSWLGVKGLGTIKTVESLKWSWQELKHSFPQGFFYGLIFGIIFSLIIARISGLAYGFAFGVFFSLLGGFRGPEIQAKAYPNQGIIKSGQNAIALAILTGLCAGLFGSLTMGWFDFSDQGLANTISSRWLYALYNALFYSLIGALLGGGTACIKHFLLRTTLYLSGSSPWNLARFLNDCTDRLFLQKVGGGYIFVHRMLLEHFAAMSLEQEKRQDV